MIQPVSPSTLGCRAKADLPNTHLSDDRSVPSQSGCSAMAAVWCGRLYGSVTRSRCMSARASPGSKVSWATQHPPAASVDPTAVLKPAVQNSGSAVHIRVPS